MLPLTGCSHWCLSARITLRLMQAVSLLQGSLCRDGHFASYSPHAKQLEMLALPEGPDSANTTENRDPGW